MKRFASVMALVVAVALSGCDSSTPLESIDTDQPSAKADLLSAFLEGGDAGTAAVLTYNDPPLVAGVDRLGSTSEVGAIGDPARWDYYRFCGTAGQVVTITVRRTTAGMDPAFSLFFGESNTTAGLSFDGSSNPDLTFLAFLDDELPPAIPGPWGDPQLLNYVLPSSGTYTLGVYDFASTGAVPYGYRIETAGFSCDDTVDLTGALDIMPGSDRNPINLRARGVIPVAIYGSSSLDVADIDPATIVFAGASPDRAPVTEDVNEDGYPDLVMHFRTQATNIAAGDTQACLTATGTDGTTSYEGCDSITIVP